MQALVVPGPGGSLNCHPVQQPEPAQDWKRVDGRLGRGTALNLNIFVPTSLWVRSSHAPEYTNPHQTLGSIPKLMWKRPAVRHAEKSDSNYSATNLNIPGRMKSWQRLAQEAYFQTAAYFCVQRNKIKVTHNTGSRHSIELWREARA